MSRLTEQQAKEILFTAQMAGYPNKTIPEILAPLYEYIENMESSLTKTNIALEKIKDLIGDDYGNPPLLKDLYGIADRCLKQVKEGGREG